MDFGSEDTSCTILLTNEVMVSNTIVWNDLRLNFWKKEEEKLINKQKNNNKQIVALRLCPNNLHSNKHEKWRKLLIVKLSKKSFVSFVYLKFQ